MLLIAFFCPFGYFFFNYPAATEIYTLSLHDALPILYSRNILPKRWAQPGILTVPGEAEYTSIGVVAPVDTPVSMLRSEEHTSELQSRGHLVCRLLLEKKKKTNQKRTTYINSLTNKHQ